MTPDQITKALDKYIARFAITAFVGPQSFSTADTRPSYTQSLGHALWMCLEAKTFAQEKPEKAMRWLCFIQGVLWSVDGWTIDEFKNDNR